MGRRTPAAASGVSLLGHFRHLTSARGCICRYSQCSEEGEWERWELLGIVGTCGCVCGHGAALECGSKAV